VTLYIHDCEWYADMAVGNGSVRNIDLRIFCIGCIFAQEMCLEILYKSCPIITFLPLRIAQTYLRGWKTGPEMQGKMLALYI
jgi:hypothetical protein